MSAISKRQFLETLAGVITVSTLPLRNWEPALAQSSTLGHDGFWQKIRAVYPVTRDFIELENGCYSLTAQDVLNHYQQPIQSVNAVSSYYMRTRQFDDKLESCEQLAELLGCSSNEVIITRNTTESLDTVIAGVDWKPGDEAIMAEQDYGTVLDMFRLQAR